MQGKKWIAAALVCGFLLGQGTAPAQAGILGTVVKGGAVSLLVSQFADQLNSAINTLTAKYPISSDYATKVVPTLPWVTEVMPALLRYRDRRSR